MHGSRDSLVHTMLSLIHEVAAAGSQSTGRSSKKNQPLMHGSRDSLVHTMLSLIHEVAAAGSQSTGP
jgi:hypothetical protein